MNSNFPHKSYFSEVTVLKSTVEDSVSTSVWWKPWTWNKRVEKVSTEKIESAIHGAVKAMNEEFDKTLFKGLSVISK